MKCVRELFKEEHHSKKQLCPLTSQLTYPSHVQFDTTNHLSGFSVLDSLLLSEETFDDFIPELIWPAPLFETMKESITPLKQEKEDKTSCHWMEPLTVDTASESSFETSRKSSCNRITPSKCLLKIAPKNYQNRRLPNKVSKSTTALKVTRSSTHNDTTRAYPYIPRRIARRKRTIFSPMQVSYLEERFAASRYMNSIEAESLGQYLGISPDTLMVWFQNRRARQRRKEMAQQRLSNSATSNRPTTSTSQSSPRQSGNLPPASLHDP